MSFQLALQAYRNGIATRALCTICGSAVFVRLCSNLRCFKNIGGLNKLPNASFCESSLNVQLFKTISPQSFSNGKNKLDKFIKCLRYFLDVTYCFAPTFFIQKFPNGKFIPPKCQIHHSIKSKMANSSQYVGRIISVALLYLCGVFKGRQNENRCSSENQNDYGQLLFALVQKSSYTVPI